MGDPYVHGHKWYTNFYYEGRRIVRPFAPAHIPSREAERLQNAIETDLHRGKRDFLKKHRATFRAAAEEFISVVVETNYKPGRNRVAATNRIRDLIRRHGKRHLADMSPWFFERLKSDRLKENVRPATVNRDIQMIRAIMNRALDWGWIEVHPAPRVKLLKGEGPRSRVLTPQEQERLFDALAAEGQVYHDIYRFAFLGALRPGPSEVLGLRWEEVDPPGHPGYYRITRAKAKTNRERLIPITPNVREILDRRPNREGFVFSRDGGVSPYSIQTTYHAFTRATRRAGLEKTGLQPKDLRRTMATRLDEEKVPITRIQALLGHTRVSMTEWYLSRKPESLDEIREDLDRAANRAANGSNMVAIASGGGSAIIGTHGK